MRSITGRYRAVVDDVAVQLFGVLSHDATTDGRPRSSAEVVAFRDLQALVTQAPFARAEPTAHAVESFRAVVEGAFHDRTIIPAPFGTFFRSREALVRWLELHYFTILDAIAFLDNRAEARVHVLPPPLHPAETASAAPAPHTLEAIAAETFRALRSVSVASLPVAIGGPLDGARASFLVDREKWASFTDLVKAEQLRQNSVIIEQTGPWPPYDFVRLQFGG